MKLLQMMSINLHTQLSPIELMQKTLVTTYSDQRTKIILG